MPDFLTITTYFSQNPGVFWVIASVVLIMIEVTVPGIGGLFSSVAAISLGALMILGAIHPESFMEELAYFFGFTIIWALILWKPLQKMMRPEDAYSDIVGTRAVVSEGGLQRGKVGKVKWSGVNMSAEIADGCDQEVLKEGDDVWIVAKEGMVLMIDTVENREGKEKPVDTSAM